MKTNTLKLGLMGVLLSLVLAGCSTTDSDDEGAGAGEAGQLPSDQVMGQKIDQDGRLMGENLTNGDAALDIDTVFYFDFDKSLLKPEARAALTMHAEQLRNNPRNIRLEGHADERGTREYNLALAERRANSVRDFLVLQGADASYVEVVSYGEERPADMASNNDAWAMNRRVELK